MEGLAIPLNHVLIVATLLFITGGLRRSRNRLGRSRRTSYFHVDFDSRSRRSLSRLRPGVASSKAL